MKDNNDPLTAALKKHFCINGVYVTFNNKRSPGNPEWRINSTCVQRITRNNTRDSKIRGSRAVRDQPLLYTYWWLFWAAAHVHRKVFPNEFTEQRIREKFEAALKEQAEAASSQQSQVRICRAATTSWLYDLSKIVP
jgi:hypothetical protein